MVAQRTSLHLLVRFFCAHRAITLRQVGRMPLAPPVPMLHPTLAQSTGGAGGIQIVAAANRPHYSVGKNATGARWAANNRSRKTALAISVAPNRAVCGVSCWMSTS